LSDKIIKFSTENDEEFFDMNKKYGFNTYPKAVETVEDLEEFQRWYSKHGLNRPETAKIIEEAEKFKFSEAFFDYNKVHDYIRNLHVQFQNLIKNDLNFIASDQEMYLIL